MVPAKVTLPRKIGKNIIAVRTSILRTNIKTDILDLVTNTVAAASTPVLLTRKVRTKNQTNRKNLKIEVPMLKKKKNIGIRSKVFGVVFFYNRNFVVFRSLLITFSCLFTVKIKSERVNEKLENKEKSENVIILHFPAF